MVAEKIKDAVVNFTNSVLNENPLATGAENGTLTAKNVNIYLRNLAWIFLQHSMLLEKAALKARADGQTSLAEFLEEKYDEERDHHKWPEQDLKNRGVQFDSDTPQYELLDSAKETIAYLESLIDEDPAHMLPYLTLVEYFTVLGAPRFIAALESKCGIKRTELTAVNLHAQADVKHVEEDLKILREWTVDQKREMIVLEIIGKTGFHVNRFLSDCAQ